MNKEQLIAKKVKHQFNGKETLFSVDSLNEHFDGLQIHESDVLHDEFEDQDEGYVKASDVNFDYATANEVLDFEDEEEEVLKEDSLDEELTIQPEDPAFGTEHIIYKKTDEEASEEIKKENGTFEPEFIEEDLPAEEIEVVDPAVIENVKEEVEYFKDPESGNLYPELSKEHIELKQAQEKTIEKEFFSVKKEEIALPKPKGKKATKK
ncbi:MAG: hypothetical protein V4666_08155 [Bacteroidota bacterium]